jgi:hypothetical protein
LRWGRLQEKQILRGKGQELSLDALGLGCLLYIPVEVSRKWLEIAADIQRNIHVRTSMGVSSTQIISKPWK